MSAGDDPGPRRASRLDVGRLFDAAEAAAPVAAADVVGRVLADALGAEEVSFLIADFSGDSLIRLGHAIGGDPSRSLRGETAERVALSGTPYGEALAGQSVAETREGDRTWLRAPVTSRGEAVGVLELRLAYVPDEQTVTDVARAAHVLAYVLIANRRYTDLFEWGQRSVPLSLAAEIQHRLLPGAYTCEAGQFTLAAWLEPAGDVGGDTFDFALERHALNLSMTDAMGHSVNAALLATLCVGSIRNGRRRGASLPEQARIADAALAEHAGGSQYVTGQLVRVDLISGAAQIVNAGHPPPLRVRGGVVDEVLLEADPPLGALPGTEFRVQELPLQAGDRLVFLTDGVLEREAGKADIRGVLAASRDDHPREAVQQVIQAAMQSTGGRLEDDATAMCFDWHGGPKRARDTDSGANVDP